MYICDFSRSVGAGSATTRKMRGLTRSVMALIVPPLPAPSRPSKRTQTLRPLCTTHCWSFTNSTCRRASSRSYPFRFSLPSPSASSFFASVIGSSLRIRLDTQSFPKNCPKCVLLPSENEADIAGHAPGIFEHFHLEVEAERPEVIVPEFVSEFGPAAKEDPSGGSLYRTRRNVRSPSGEAIRTSKQFVERALVFGASLAVHSHQKGPRRLISSAMGWRSG